MDQKTFFWAYPSNPSQISTQIQAAAKQLKTTNVHVSTWQENDILGRNISDAVFKSIRSAEAVICDVTKLNFNVAVEAGYAIGSGKRLFFTLNNGISNDSDKIRNIGLFDTIGYSSYSNTNELIAAVQACAKSSPPIIGISFKRDYENPIYVIEPYVKSDAAIRVISRIKKAHLRFKSFNPTETPRLSLDTAVERIAASSGVALQISSANELKAELHNIRVAFCAGIAIALKKPLCILIEYGEIPPLDVVDMLSVFREPNDIDVAIAEFCQQVVVEFQSVSPVDKAPAGGLAALSIGDPMAENEMTSLASYYLDTDQFQKALRAEANIIAGRKGMGKTALFISLRDTIRRDKDNIVVDLKPEGYQLRKLRNELKDIISESSIDHLITTFWEYLLYTEIGNKLIEKDSRKSLHDHDLRAKYDALQNILKSDSAAEEGDFSERLHDLVKSIQSSETIKKLQSQKKSNAELSNATVTEIVRTFALPELRKSIIAYLRFKKSLWILFDNIDKGWPIQNIDVVDSTILRCLIDSGKKIKRELNKNSIVANSLVFVRNDVYDLLMRNTADFGKEMRIQLDWSDRALLKRMLFFRMIKKDDKSGNISSVWAKYFDKLIDGEDTLEFIIDRSLMRPRNLIKFIYHCRSAAINDGANLVRASHLKKALNYYSNDVLQEADEELSDIMPTLRGKIYNLVEKDKYLNSTDIVGAFEISEKSDDYELILSYLLYYGFLGVILPGSDPQYIYDFNYNTKIMDAWCKARHGEFLYHLNPAFWPALRIRSQ